MKTLAAIQILEEEVQFVAKTRQRLLAIDSGTDINYAEGLADSDRKIEALKMAIDALTVCKTFVELTQRFES